MDLFTLFGAFWGVNFPPKNRIGGVFLIFREKKMKKGVVFDSY